MDLGIKGKTALVLASSRGLGQAMAVALAREGVQVAITGRNPEGLAQTVAMIEAVGGKPWRFWCNPGDTHAPW